LRGRQGPSRSDSGTFASEAKVGIEPTRTGVAIRRLPIWRLGRQSRGMIQGLMADMKLRALGVSLLVMLAPALDGCSNDGGQRVCTDSISMGCHFDCSKSIEAYCAAAGGCHLTWAAVLADPGLCAPSDLPSENFYTNTVSDCGSYHVLWGGGEYGAAIGYYDLATGTLVAEVLGDHSQPFLSCGGGPPGRFTPPDCTTSTPLPLPLCSADGGADGP
jgi:hypothetical protein